jgi:hypothetical protein
MSTVVIIGAILGFCGGFVGGVGVLRNGPTAPVDGYDVIAFGLFCAGVGLVAGAAFG